MGVKDSTMTSRTIIVLSALLVAVARSQTAVQPAEGPLPPTQLQTMELIYQKNLRAAQAPVVKEYLAQLSALLATSPAADTAAINGEIARVQKMATAGTVEFSGPKTIASPLGPAAAGGIVFTLEPHEAQPPQKDDALVPIGEASWTLSKLPAGQYDVVAHYTCPTLPASPTVTLDYHGITLSRELKSTQVTKDDKSMRVIRLGQLKLSEDVLLEKVTLKAASTSQPWLFIKQILIVKAKDAK
jgi:hypothetical protein